MRILCVCSHGNVRSVALAYLLKTIYKHEAIAIGKKTTSKETYDMLSEWADMVIDVQKMVGDDVWHNPFHPALQHKLLKQIDGLFDNTKK